MNTASRARTIPVLVASFLASTLAMAISYFGLAYSQVSLPNALYGYGLALMFALAIAVRASGSAGLLLTAAVLALAPPAVVMLRIVRDVAADPTSHNLWPFEVVIAVVVGVVVATAGALVGTLLHRLLRR